jgi:hypothetical protein
MKRPPVGADFLLKYAVSLWHLHREGARGNKYLDFTLVQSSAGTI